MQVKVEKPVELLRGVKEGREASGGLAYQPKMTVHDPNKRNLNEKLFQELQRQRVGVEGERDSRGEKEREREREVVGEREDLSYETD